MVAPVNDFDVRLQSESPRTLAPRGGIILSATTNVITIDGGGAPSVSTVSLVATPLSVAAVAGSVTWSTSPTVPLTIDQTGLIAILKFADMGLGSVAVTATLTANGLTYTDSRTISQVSIGSLGYQGALDATRNSTSQGPLASRPAGANGDFYFATDALVLYQKINGAWAAAGNNFTNTSQLTDGAGLGQTAQWGGVSGTGRPADNATVNNFGSGLLANRPTGSNGDLYFATDNNILYQKVSGYWGTAANNYTNTSQLFDGAKLGQTALWTSVDQRPADDQIKNNLTDLSWWRRLNTIPWTTNGEYNVICDSLGDYGVVGPKGVSDTVWLCEEQGLANSANGDNPGGGWNWANVTIDPTKTYRFVLPVRRLTGVGASYWGINESGVANLNGVLNPNDQYSYPGTDVARNPYFANYSNLLDDRWYLFVGYIYPAGSTGNTHNGAGIYDCKTRQKIADGLNFNARAGVSVISHRAYQYYASNGARQMMARPLVNLVDGTEPPLSDFYGQAVLGQNVGGQIDGTNVSALIAPRAIGSVQISDLRTSNYAEDASGNPTAGAKLMSTGTALKVANNSFQVGSLVFSDYWFRLVQGIDGSVTSNRIIWRGNNDATTRGGAPNINCLSIIPGVSYTIANSTNGNNLQLSNHQFVLTPTSYVSNTDNLDAVQQIHVQYFAKTADTKPFTEVYTPCPSRTYDGASGIVRGAWHWSWPWYNISDPNFPDADTQAKPQALIKAVTQQVNGTAFQVSYPVFGGYLRVRIANTYGWSATKDFGPPVDSGSGFYTAGMALPAATITGVAGSAGGGSGSSGGACPAPWVKVRLLSGKDVNASDLHNGARLAAVNDSTMEALPQGGVVRDLVTIWAQRYRVKLADGSVSEWSENHRFAVAERGWVTVQNLRGGDQILGLTECVVDSVLAVGEGQVVSFRVEGAGTYFAGSMLCHNAKASF